jgi:hypothetical protein
MEELEGADTLSHSAHTHTTTTTANNTSGSSTVNTNGHQSSAAATSTSNGITGNSSSTTAAVNDGSGSNVTPRGSPKRQNAWNEDETEASFH